MEIKNDTRSLKTRKAIKRAFIAMLKKNDFDDVSIIELTSLAGVSRNSFYNHYNSVIDIVDDIFLDVEVDLMKIIEKYLYKDFLENERYVVNELISLINGNISFSRYIIFSPSNGIFVQKLIRYLSDEVSKIYNALPELKVITDYYINFLISGIIQTIYKWFLDGQDISKDDLINNLSLFIKNGILMLRNVKENYLEQQGNDGKRII